MMPFDETNDEGGGGHDPHDDLEEIAEAMIDAAALTAMGNGACLDCAMKLAWIKMTAVLMNRLMDGYVRRLKSSGYSTETDEARKKLTSAASNLTADKLSLMLDDAKQRAVQIAKENSNDEGANHRGADRYM